MKRIFLTLMLLIFMVTPGFAGEPRMPSINMGGPDWSGVLSDITIKNATPSLNFKDTDATAGDINASMDANATDTGDGTEDIDVWLKQQIAGTIRSFLYSDADGGLTLGATTQDVTINATKKFFFDGDIASGIPTHTNLPLIFGIYM